MLLHPLLYSILMLVQMASVRAVDTTTDTLATAAAAAADTTTDTLATAAAAVDTTTTAAAAAAADTTTTAAAAAAAAAETTTDATALTDTATTATAATATTGTDTTALTDATGTITTPATAATATTGTDTTALTGTTTTPTTALTDTATTATAATATTGTDTTALTDTTGTTTTPTTVATATTGTGTTTNTNTLDTTTDSSTTDTTGTTSTNTDTESSTSSTSSTSSASETVDSSLVSDSIVGTWSSKSNTVFTGPGFFDPVDELLMEPALPGISYSFTEDGYWEEAIYQVSPNPKNHSCATAVLIFQHGTYVKKSNGTLILTPFVVDGRQLLSQPCDDDGISIYSRYNQTEVFKAYQVYVDPYHGKWRIDLIKSTGEYMQPLYLAYQPPEMLPTITMNPTASSGSASQSTGQSNEKREYGLDDSLKGRIRRSLENRYKTNAIRKDSFNHSLWWWSSLSMMVLGAVIFIMA